MSVDYYPGNGPPFLMRLSVNPQTGVVSYLNNVGADVPILTINPNLNGWVPLKIVGNFQTGRYTRAFVGDEIFNLNSAQLFPSGSGEVRKSIVNVRGRGLATGNVEIGVGYIVMTKDEHQ